MENIARLRCPSKCSSLWRSFSLIYIFMFLATSALPAAAQSIGFSAADYGKIQLPIRQSTGDAAAYIDTNKGAFEPIAELDPNDPLAVLAHPIGRVDILMRNSRTGEEFGASCTGELLPGDYVLTNHHCLPMEGDVRPVKASILMDYVTLDGKGAQRFDLEPQPAEWSSKLDYAITKAQGRPTGTYGAVKIAALQPGESRSLLVIHHPVGRPKVMSRFRCMAIKEQDDTAELRHRCDTLGGSSGSILIDSRSFGIALHKEGGLDPTDPSSFNTATSMVALLAASPILRAMADAEDKSTSGQQPVAPQHPVASDMPTTGSASRPDDDIGKMNGILRGQ